MTVCAQGYAVPATGLPVAAAWLALTVWTGTTYHLARSSLPPC